MSQQSDEINRQLEQLALGVFGDIGLGAFSFGDIGGALVAATQSRFQPRFIITPFNIGQFFDAPPQQQQQPPPRLPIPNFPRAGGSSSPRPVEGVSNTDVDARDVGTVCRAAYDVMRVLLAGQQPTPQLVFQAIQVGATAEELISFGLDPALLAELPEFLPGAGGAAREDGTAPFGVGSTPLAPNSPFYLTNQCEEKTHGHTRHHHGCSGELRDDCDRCRPHHH